MVHSDSDEEDGFGGTPGSPPRGAGALLQAASPRTGGAPGSSNLRKDALGKTVVEVIEYEKFDPKREYSASVQKSAKFSGKWVPRFITLRDIDLSYSMAEGQSAKDTIQFFKVTRGGELGRDPLSLVVEGRSSKEKKQVEFMFKCEKPDEARLWYLRLAQALAAGNSMDMPMQGVPLANPRTGLPFVTIPVEHLAVFAPLDRLVLHFFAGATHKYIASGAISRMVEMTGFVFIGDACVYVCDPAANIKRCIAVKAIKSVLTVSATSGSAPAPAATGGAASTAPPSSASSPSFFQGSNQTTIGLQCAMPEYDCLFTIAPEPAEKFVSTLIELHSHIGIPKSQRGKPEAMLKRVKLAKEGLLLPQLSLEPTEFYELKIRLPMSRRYLLKMVADGVAGGHLVVKPLIQSLLPGAAAVTSGAKAPSVPPAVGASNGATTSTSTSLNANPLSTFESKTDAAVKKPTVFDDSDDSDTEAIKKRAQEQAATAAQPSVTANPIALAVGAKPKPVFDDSDSDIDLPKPSPLAGTFGAASRPTDVNGASSLLGGGAPPPPPPGGSGGLSAGPSSMLGIDRMHTFLHAVGLPQYYATFIERGVDWEALRCMDTLSLKKYGVASVDHQIKIENALGDASVMSRVTSATGAPPPPPPPGGGGPAPPPPSTGFAAGGGPPPPPPRRPIDISDDDL